MSEPRDENGLRSAVLIAYALFLLAPINGLTAIAGIVVVYLKREEARGTIWQSHLRNLLWVFWVSVLFFAAAAMLVLPGLATLLFALFETNGNPPAGLVGGLLAALPALALASLLFGVWYLYRTIAGLVRAVDGQPY
jgi:uncharacterized membrane protein